MDISAVPQKNQLLAALPDAEVERWLPPLEWVEMPLGQVLYESGCTLRHVYFPTTTIASLLYGMENGASAEIAVVGKEGLVGISPFMGGGSTPSRAVAQSAGEGFRLKLQALKIEFDRAGLVLRLLLRLDRLDSNELFMTQELIANMLGVRREGVTESALKLQKAGLIHYTRGRIMVLYRPGLKEYTCECYGVVKKEYDRLLPKRVAS